jgi:hypothetical protein
MTYTMKIENLEAGQILFVIKVGNRCNFDQFCSI